MPREPLQIVLDENLPWSITAGHVALAHPRRVSGMLRYLLNRVRQHFGYGVIVRNPTDWYRAMRVPRREWPPYLQ